MDTLKDYFEPGTFSLAELFGETPRNNWGLSIPNYQREYKWKTTDQTVRLRDGLYSDFMRLANQKNTIAFLGSIIFAEQDKSVSGHQPVDIVDGQQRITTLSLFSAAILVCLSQMKTEIEALSSLNESEKVWLNEEIEEAIAHFEDFLFLSVKGPGRKTIPLPRLVRSEDTLEKTRKDSEFKSPIAVTTYTLSGLEPETYKDFAFPPLVQNTTEGKQIIEVFADFKEFLGSLSDKNKLEDKYDTSLFEAEKLKRKPIVDLFMLSDSAAQRVANIAIQDEMVAKRLRILLFSNFIIKRAGFATITSKIPEAAFDIFDALNTTGIPLTAIETLKPDVIQHYSSNKRNVKYEGSRSETAFNALEATLKENFPETSAQERETKALVIATALYIRGEKTSENLSIQRRKLTELQRDANKAQGPHILAETLKTVLDYRQNFYKKDGIAGIASLPGLAGDEVYLVKIISSLFFQSGTSLAVPSAARFHFRGKRDGDLSGYLDFLKALTAFFVLRRASSGGTDGIDGHFRGIMNDLDIKSDLDEFKRLPEISQVKAYLKQRLKNSKLSFNVNEKNKWVEHVAKMPIYSQSKTILRFMLIAAHHHTGKDPSANGLLTRHGVTASNARNFLHWDVWNGELYDTLEHIAPNSEQTSGWSGIYDNPETRHTVGNFTLIPKIQNINLGTKPWETKKLFFAALSSSDTATRESLLDEAVHSKDLTISIARLKELKSATASNLLEGLEEVGDWDKNFVEKRSIRLCELAWDTITPWLN